MNLKDNKDQCFAVKSEIILGRGYIANRIPKTYFLITLNGFIYTYNLITNYLEVPICYS